MVAPKVSYTYARANLAKVLDFVEDAQEPVIIKRRGHADIALLPASEFRALAATAHLLRSPGNAKRLLAALQRALESPLET